MILTAGDSFTYGDELTNRTESAWPYLIAQRMGVDCQNVAEPGGSNDTAVRLIVEHTVRQQFDLVIMGWTLPERFETWNEL